MKKKSIVFLIVLFASITLAGCAVLGNNNPFVGAWRENDFNETYFFYDDGTYETIWEFAGNIKTNSGKYTFDDEELTCNDDAGSSTTYKYSISDGILTTNKYDESHMASVYRKTDKTAEDIKELYERYYNSDGSDLGWSNFNGFNSSESNSNNSIIEGSWKTESNDKDLTDEAYVFTSDGRITRCYNVPESAARFLDTVGDYVEVIGDYTIDSNELVIYWENGIGATFYEYTIEGDTLTCTEIDNNTTEKFVKVDKTAEQIKAYYNSK